MSAEPKESAEISGDVVQDPNVEETDESEFKPQRIFINHVDGFNSKHFAAYVTDQIYGASKLLGEMGGEGGGGEESPRLDPIITPAMQKVERYEVVGTLSASFQHPSEDILAVVDDRGEHFREEILKCGVIIYDISKRPEEIDKALRALKIICDDLEHIKSVGEKTYDRFNETKIFILISTIMTWALSKPLDPDDPGLAFSEVDYRKRRPHINYKTHHACEKEVIKTGLKYPDKLKTYVMCTGITYGAEEDDLDFFFRMAWYNEVLPIFGPGTNIIPLIHVKDLAKALHGLIEVAPKKPQYVLAVEQTPSTLKQIIKNLSKALSDNKTINTSREEAFLYTEMTQAVFDKVMVNINMEPVFLVENLQIEWQSEQSLPENMNQIVSEYRKAWNLNPVKVVVHGPPGSGKSKLAEKLVEFYKVHYVSVPIMLEECLQDWKDSLLRAKEKPTLDLVPEEFGEEQEEVEDEEDDVQQIKDQIQETEMLMANGLENMPDDYVINILKSYLAKNLCQNRGYVLDGFPKITLQARELFGQANEVAGGEEAEEAAGLGGDRMDKILPDLVVSLQASDDYICQRIMQLREEQIKDTPYEEDKILASLAEYRMNNTEDNTVLNYFDELEVDILLIDLEMETLEEALELVVKKLGPASGFGLSLSEREEIYRLDDERHKLEIEKEQMTEQMLMEQAEQDRNAKMEAWAEALQKMQMEEEKILVASSEPLRHYLMKFIFPLLTKGLIEVAKTRPDDPIDFLAEFLFKENPEARIFDPSYNEACEDIYEEFKRDIERIIMQSEEFGDK